MKKETPEQKLKEMQDIYHRLVRATVAYLDAEINFVEVSHTYHKAQDIVERAYTSLIDTIEGKEETK